MPARPFTAEQKKVMQDALDENVPWLKCSVEDSSYEYADNDPEYDWLKATALIGTKLVSSVGMSTNDPPEREVELLKLRAQDAALCIWEEKRDFVAKNLGRLDAPGMHMDAFSVLQDSKVLRDYIRELHAGGELIEAMDEMEERQPTA